jgi:hypothetical protein
MRERSIPTVLRLFLLGVRPPEPGASRLVRLRFVRDLQIRSLLLSVPLSIVVVLLVDWSWAPIVLGAVLLLALLNIAYLTTLLARATPADDSGRPEL